MDVLAFAASPRLGGNSETLLDSAIAGLAAAGAVVEKIRTHELAIEPCTGCGACHTTGRCVIDDAFQDIAARLISCSGMVFAAPLYFMNVPARGKALIDRCQSFWAARELLGVDLFDGHHRHGLLIGCSAKRHGPGHAPIFRGLEDTMTYVFRSLGMTQVEPLLVSGVEQSGAAAGRSDLLDRAKQAGENLARALRSGAS